VYAAYDVFHMNDIHDTDFITLPYSTIALCLQDNHFWT